MPASAQQFVPIEEIRDGVVILKGGELRSVILTSSINFDLKSTEEQEALIFEYQNFLNSLDFSVQFFVQSRKLDIRPYLFSLEELLKDQQNELIKIQTREYIQFIKSFTESTNIMTKNFFVVVPYAPAVFDTPGNLLSKVLGNKKTATEKGSVERFAENRSQLAQREQVVLSGLSRFGVRGTLLGTEELVELFYKLFNPGEMGKPAPIETNR